nr:hypothetical protein [Kribbella qitaiheensis]
MLPQAMRSILPNAANEVISLFKGTSIVSVMAIPELFYQVQVIYGRNSRVVPLLALHRAGIVHFAGPELSVALGKDRFVATSPAVQGEIEARAFVEARLPRPDVLAATDPLVRGLLRSGLLAADHLVAADGTSLGGGQLKADASCRAIKADGSVHPSLFLLGPSVSGSAGSSGFSRPHFNGPGFRQNDAVARQLLRLLDVSSQQTSQKAGQRHAS